MIRDFTAFKDNAVAIDPAGCGCTDCICGDSVPLNEFGMGELVQQALRGRKLINRTDVPLLLDRSTGEIRSVPEDYPDRWRFSPETVVLVDAIEVDR